MPFEAIAQLAMERKRRPGGLLILEDLMLD
jgi:hypothetical protein